MGCVDRDGAVDIAKRRVLGRFAGLRRTPPTVVVRVGDDWLVGFVKASAGDDRLRVEVRWAYVDCKGEAFEKLPQEALARIGRLLEALPGLLEREL